MPVYAAYSAAHAGPAACPLANAAASRVTNRIRRLRFDNGEMTQQALADKVGVTRQTIIALESDKYVPSLLLAFRLAATFGVTIEDVFQFESSAANGKQNKTR